MAQVTIFISDHDSSLYMPTVESMGWVTSLEETVSGVKVAHTIESTVGASSATDVKSAIDALNIDGVTTQVE
jgi:hypothetical protein